MRMIAITLVALTGNMLSVSLYGTERSVRFSAFVMQLSAFGLGVITLLIPAALTWFTILYAVVGFGFSAATRMRSDTAASVRCRAWAAAGISWLSAMAILKYWSS